MRVGTIGSGAIVERMIDAMNQTESIDVVACYSRTEQRAKEFCAKENVSKYYTNLDEMLKDEDIDTIYVASPNSLHYAQSKMALLAKKNVICEKPFCPTVKECEELFQLAKENGVYIFEAITNIHVPNFKIVKDNLDKVGEVRMVQCNYSQFSSRYDRYKNHIITNAFDPAFNGGALMDINVYCIHFVTGLFGRPESSVYTALKGYNGIDTSGIVVMKYPEIVATCAGAKDSSSDCFVFVQGDKGCIRVTGSGPNVCSKVDFAAPKGDQYGKKDTSCNENMGIEQKMHMTYECEEFQRIVSQKDNEAYEKLCDHTHIVVEILERSLAQI